jgi:hypothetical protein
LLLLLFIRLLALGQSVTVAPGHLRLTAPKEASAVSAGPPNDPKRSPGYCVKLDTFHAMKRLLEALPKKHGAFHPFARRFQDAMFRVDEQDYDILVGDIMRTDGCPEEVLKKCRRHARQPEDMLARLIQVFEVFKDVVDADSGKPLIPAGGNGEKQWNSLLHHVNNACLSDRPDVNLFYKRDKELLCARGTSKLESYHLLLRQVLAGSNNSAEWACLLMSAFVLDWNTNIDVLNGLVPELHHRDLQASKQASKQAINQSINQSINFESNRLFMSIAHRLSFVSSHVFLFCLLAFP